MCSGNDLPQRERMKDQQPIVLTGPERLRAIAVAIESGRPLSEVAAQFRIPPSMLQRTITPRRRCLPSDVVDADLLARAARLVGDGLRLSDVAAALEISLPVLTAELLKDGVTIRNLRERPSPLPTSVLQETPAAKPRRPSNVVNAEVLAKAARLVGGGISVPKVAACLDVNLATLTTYLFNKGLTAGSLRKGNSPWEKKLRLAVAGERLRAIAVAIESGRPLTEVAAQFRIVPSVLQRVITRKRPQARPSTIVNSEVLAKAVKMVGKGRSLREVAAVLGVNVSTLAANMAKHGVTVRRLRKISRRGRWKPLLKG